MKIPNRSDTAEKRTLATKIALHFLGSPYIWGGDDPMRGFDCSGFVIEVLKSIGVLPRSGDWTAANLWELFKRHHVNKPYTGCLVFYRARQSENSPIIHVEYCIDAVHTIGASGGGSKTNTVDDAVKQNAYIKIRPINNDRWVHGFLDPFGGRTLIPESQVQAAMR